MLRHATHTLTLLSLSSMFAQILPHLQASGRSLSACEPVRNRGPHRAFEFRSISKAPMCFNPPSNLSNLSDYNS